MNVQYLNVIPLRGGDVDVSGDVTRAWLISFAVSVSIDWFVIQVGVQFAHAHTHTHVPFWAACNGGGETLPVEGGP